MKKSILIFFVIAIISILAAVSCSKQSEDTLVPQGGITCDTTAVQYSIDVVSILQANCYRCHGAATNGGSGGIILEGYSNLKKWADNGYLIGNITHAPGYVPMPYDGGKLSDCDINKIQAWINQGTQNN